MSKERQTMAPSSRRIRATITPTALAAAFLILGAGASRSAQIDLLVADDASSLYRYDGFTGALSPLEPTRLNPKACERSRRH
jgi:hypothetical protein